MSFKSQSAMEYLMTYGWAILIIAIVMIAMFSLGIFNAQEPRVSAGACEVYRSATSSPTLTGECQGVWPQFVAQFNGQDSYVSTSENSLLLGAGATSVNLWMNPSSLGTGQNGWIDEETVFGLKFTQPSTIYFCLYPIVWCSQTTYSFYTNTWYDIAVSWSSGNQITYYINGKVVGTSGILSGTITSTPGSIFEIGEAISDNSGTSFNGMISNVQIYNTSLSQAEITALYHEGIGGAPIDPNNIVGWWPLNGRPPESHTQVRGLLGTRSLKYLKINYVSDYT